MDQVLERLSMEGTVEDLYERVLGPTAAGDLLMVVLSVVRDVDIITFLARCPEVCKDWYQVCQHIPSAVQRLKTIYASWEQCVDAYSSDLTSTVVTDALCLRVYDCAFMAKVRVKGDTRLTFPDLMRTLGRYGGWVGREQRRLKTLHRFIEYPSLRVYTVPTTAVMRRARTCVYMPADCFAHFIVSNQVLGGQEHIKQLPEQCRALWRGLMKRVLTEEHVMIVAGTIPEDGNDVMDKGDVLAVRRPHTSWYIVAKDTDRNISSLIRIPHYVCQSKFGGRIGMGLAELSLHGQVNRCLGPRASGWEVIQF